MSVEDVFIEGIRAAPHDPLPRLVYADYLEESGDPRGELIRIQCELASDHHERGDAFRAALIDRERELLAQHGDQWLAPLRALGAEGVTTACFRGGLIERIRIPAKAFLRNAEEICRIAPALQAVHLRDVGAISRADAMAFPEQITTVDLSANRFSPEWLQTIGQEPWLRWIVELNLRFNRLSDQEVALLARMEMPALRSLGLASNAIADSIGPGGFQDLTQWPTLGHVEELDLSANAIGDERLRLLCESPHVASLRKLNLASCQIANVRPLMHGGRFDSLEELNLRSNRIPAAALRRLAESDFGRRLKSLDVRGNSAGHR
jgi:uncharacterized protein (TIGR02996 family)